MSSSGENRSASSGSEPTPAQREYRENYLRSTHWQIVRAGALDRADHRCQVCNSKRKLDVHHRTYARLGHEHPADLTVLCRTCHELFHDRLPTAPDHPRERKSKRRKPTRSNRPRLLSGLKQLEHRDAENARKYAERQRDQAARARDQAQADFIPRHIREPRDWREERQLPRKDRP